VVELKSAYNSFKLAYDSKPGDFKVASDFWGVSNGDGDGIIEYAEAALAWIHLNESEIVNFVPESTLAGVTANLYPATFGDSVWYMFGLSQINPGFVNFLGENFTVLYLIKTTNVWEGGITPKEAYLIDKKYDDGSPVLGKMLALDQNTSANGCLDPGNYVTSTAEYQITSPDHCRLVFNID